MRPFSKVAVLGSGVMGGGIAAHLANAGARVLLLDLTAAQAQAGLDAAKAAKPAAFFTGAEAALVEVGGFDEDLPRLAGCDWVIEVVLEDLSVKQRLFERVAPHLSADAVLSSNTSGLSVEAMARALPADLRRRFLVTHFFNPPRYLRLVEVVPCADTDPEVVARVEAFLERRLGKGVVRAKDTPNFVANRIGVFALCNVVKHVLELGLTVEEADAAAGPATARPRSAAFRTADLVGLDTLLHVADNSHAVLQQDEEREVFRLPDFLREMVKQGLRGNKSKAGFYKKEKGEGGATTERYFDFRAGRYEPVRRPRFASVEATKGIDDPAARLRAVLAGDDPAAELAWRNLRDTLLYAFRRVPEIADDVSAVDRAMRWGFNWELGPFEMLDAIGVARFRERARKDGSAIPARLDEVERFYRVEGGRREVLDLATGAFREVPRPEGRIDLALVKAGGVVERNPGASVLDLGDGVFGLEFHSKMNAIGNDTLAMVHKALARAEREGQALVIANQGAAFSAGANLALLAMAIVEGEWDEIALTVQRFQRATMALALAQVPVVAAPHQLALGGGCEVCLHATAMNPHSETYMGLVEVGVGLLPAGGGTKELALRAIRLAEQWETDVSPFLFKSFKQIATARVSTSAAELRDMGYLRPGDAVTMNADDLVADAKRKALALAANFRPRALATGLAAPGRGVAASLASQLWNLRMGGFITAYEEHLGKTIARVITGGDVPAGTPITEEWLLEQEREAFVSLCGEKRTLERIQHMLKKGKPLRN
ncbi:3-hydroxyacyl-CoA dehydrogenase/enoyl-CoA hydratase family protein [Anaeromyxobacter paludicola]|uniref:3-hydroxyacyl-CoA dehydrogenase n=1 Tax=Anaeromyxobacter paludicola TaxID=2918171 RepID=A0ABN6NDI4_9BACT|nr:3-hydroxyacyl-CoA dehydrogenase/enoyl-CoA hydratase family protein [Anaeromyxobacter paludicola]BDG10110.1 3-hydroxyacyl-CoA dehydrogenase [Anaeromyxobacter paludicola]